MENARQQSSVQGMVAELANQAEYIKAVSAEQWETREIDHPTKKDTKVTQYRVKGTDDWLKQSEVFSLVVGNQAFEVLQLDDDIIPTVLSQSGTKVRSTHKISWIKSEIVGTKTQELCERIKGIVTLTELSIKALKVEEQLSNMAKNASLKFNPEDILKVKQALLPKFDTAFNTLFNKASDHKEDRGERAKKPVRYVAI